MPTGPKGQERPAKAPLLSASVMKGATRAGSELFEVVLQGVDVALQLVEGKTLGRDERPPGGVGDMALNHQFDPRGR